LLREEDMEEIHGLTPEEARELPLHMYARHVMLHEDGVWTSHRVLDAWEEVDWDFSNRHKYSLNVAGNVLTRLHLLKAVERVGCGWYTANPERLAEVQWGGIKRMSSKLRPSVKLKITPEKFR
jgi:hypothetical protein